MAQTHVTREIPGDGRIVIAFSGGPDSVCLAALLARSDHGRPLTCVHVDHGLDAASPDRAAQACRIAAGLGLECIVERVEIDTDGSTEAAARKARYAVLARHLQRGECLVTAHHADDQTETILMRLLRGAGPAGLAGIPAQRPFAKGWLTRPLLHWTRAEILDWLAEQQLEWVNDPSNLSLSFDRNYIRHEVMPVLVRRWPGAAAAIRRSGRLSEGAADAVTQMARLDLHQGLSPGRKLSQTCLENLTQFRQAEMLRYWCQKESRPLPPGPQLDEFLDQLARAAPDRLPELRWEDQVLRCYDRCLWLDQDFAEPELNEREWDGTGVLDLPHPIGSLTVAGTAVEFSPALKVRFGEPGEKIRLPGRGHHHAVRKLMSEAGIPPWQRPLWPRLWEGDRLVAVGQRWLEQEFAEKLVSRGCALVWRTDLYAAGTGLE